MFSTLVQRTNDPLELFARLLIYAALQGAIRYCGERHLEEDCLADEALVLSTLNQMCFFPDHVDRIPGGVGMSAIEEQADLTSNTP
jgi:hypothetical protein